MAVEKLNINELSFSQSLWDQSFHCELPIVWVLTLCLLVSSADNFCKQIGVRSGLTKHRPNLDPNCLTLRQYSWKNILKSWFWEKSADVQKSMQNFPAFRVKRTGVSSNTLHLPAPYVYRVQLDSLLKRFFFPQFCILWKLNVVKTQY